ncbi:MAG: hypothetical protein LBN09_08045 [Clostridioides sp.]|jgi:hypothetical protein|nr:hypothetical protein [Clostridioides sp.]
MLEKLFECQCGISGAVGGVVDKVGGFVGGIFDGLFDSCTLWILLLLALFLIFKDQFEDIEVCDWIPFLILLLIVSCSCGTYDDCCE